MLGMMSAYANGPMLGVFGGPDENICLVSKVIADSPASQAGIQIDDRILSFDGQPIANFRDLQSLIATKQPGDTVTLTLVREEEMMETTVTLARRGDPSEWR
jgi:S1-C subfamily serine protease